jgi:hypothetical protein
MVPSMVVMTSGIIDDDSDSTRMNEHDELKSELFRKASTNACTIVAMIDCQSFPSDGDISYCACDKY